MRRQHCGDRVCGDRSFSPPSFAEHFFRSMRFVSEEPIFLLLSHMFHGTLSMGIP
jgi:hypothetical protein